MDKKESLSNLKSDIVEETIQETAKTLAEELEAEIKTKPDWAKGAAEAIKDSYNRKIEQVKKMIKEEDTQGAAEGLEELKEAREEILLMKKMREEFEKE